MYEKSQGTSNGRICISQWRKSDAKRRQLEANGQRQEHTVSNMVEQID
jgi:hypothetical protein